MRLVSTLLVFALLACWAGCSSDDTATSDGGKPDATTDASKGATDGGAADVASPVELKPYQILGRFDSRDTAGPRFGWPGTQVIAKFSGDKVSVDLSDTSGEDIFDWSVDGSKPVIFPVAKDKKTYELASGLAAGAHELVLTKRTESSVGESQLFAINATLTGTPPPSARHIEMIGDSITAGYGVLGENETCTFSPETETETEAWGALAAAQLKASHTAIAWSGIGLVQDYEGDTDGNMPERYPRALATDAASIWAPSSFEPDVVVINLGTNDLSGEGIDPGVKFQTTLVSFVTTIRTTHANAQIVLAMSPMLTDQNRADQMKYYKGAIDARAAAGDRKLSLLDIPVPPVSNGFGCDFHPSAKTHQDMAAALVAHLKPLLGW